MEAPSIGSFARMIAEDALRENPGLGPSGAEALAHRLETALRTVVREERLACAAECDRRRALWTGTEERAGTPPSLRAEARFRASEAAVLGDALRARSTS